MNTLGEYVTTPGRPAASRPVSRTRAAAAHSRSRSAPVAARSAAASATSSAAPRSAARQGPADLLGGGHLGHHVHGNREMGRGDSLGLSPTAPRCDRSQTVTDSRSGSALPRLDRVLVAVQVARPPDLAAEVEVDRGDQDRPDDQRVEQDAQRHGDAELHQEHERQRGQHEERRREHQPGRRDHSTGRGQGDQRPLAGAVVAVSSRTRVIRKML